MISSARLLPSRPISSLDDYLEVKTLNRFMVTNWPSSQPVESLCQARKRYPPDHRRASPRCRSNLKSSSQHFKAIRQVALAGAAPNRSGFESVPVVRHEEK